MAPSTSPTSTSSVQRPPSSSGSSATTSLGGGGGARGWAAVQTAVAGEEEGGVRAWFSPSQNILWRTYQVRYRMIYFLAHRARCATE
jgi:hypothetical protein